MKTRWIIDFDYDADPETPAAELRTDIADHLSGARGRTVIEGTRIIFDHGDDALAARLRYNENICRVITEHA